MLAFFFEPSSEVFTLSFLFQLSLAFLLMTFIITIVWKAYWALRWTPLSPYAEYQRNGTTRRFTPLKAGAAALCFLLIAVLTGYATSAAVLVMLDFLLKLDFIAPTYPDYISPGLGGTLILIGLFARMFFRINSETPLDKDNLSSGRLWSGAILFLLAGALVFSTPFVFLIGIMALWKETETVVKLLPISGIVMTIIAQVGFWRIADNR